MEFEFPQYESKGHGEGAWKEVTEIEAFKNLADTFPEVVPMLTELLNGKVIKISGGLCRVRKVRSQ